MSEPTNKSNRPSAQKAIRAGAENAFGGSNALLWTAVKAVSGAQARAAGRMTSKPFIPSLSQSIVETTDRKAGCGRSARPVWMGGVMATWLLSISTLLLGEPETLSFDTLQRTLGRLIHNEKWETKHVAKSL